MPTHPSVWGTSERCAFHVRVPPTDRATFLAVATFPGVLRSIWRHPVKSMQGEQLAEGVVEPGGLHGDRGWASETVRPTGSSSTGRREPRLLSAAAVLDDAGRPVITLPDGSTLCDVGPQTDGGLSEWLGRPVALVVAEGVPSGGEPRRSLMPPMTRARRSSGRCRPVASSTPCRCFS